MPAEGLEPPLPYENQILSLARLPFRHAGNFLRTNELLRKEWRRRESVQGRGRLDDHGVGSYQVDVVAVIVGELAIISHVHACRNTSAQASTMPASG